ncbi:hypothetical protein HDU90_002330 [Geranomyces variabilis]|nr:hypothetical protein HDU90_002330 [Geranomyces variabilis]
MAPFDVLLVIRSFYKAISKFERMSTFESTAEGADEDTEVHAVLHSLMDEIFDHPKLIMRWANGSSHSSKDHRAAYRQKPCGKKPDGRVLSNKSEQIFLETKSSKYADSAGQTLYDLFKLAQFCQGAINFKSKQKFQNFPCYGIQFLRDTIEIYQMDLSYDGIYTMVNLASCRVPRRLDDLCLLPPLIAAMLHIKTSILATLPEEATKMIVSGAPQFHPLRNMAKLPSPNFSNLENLDFMDSA